MIDEVMALLLRESGYSKESRMPAWRERRRCTDSAEYGSSLLRGVTPFRMLRRWSLVALIERFA